MTGADSAARHAHRDEFELIAYTDGSGSAHGGSRARCD